MTAPAPDGLIRAAEEWFVAHGLPYFDDSQRQAVSRALERRRLWLLTTVALLLGAVAGLAVGVAVADASTGTVVGLLVACLVLAAYAFTTLQMAAIARWAGAHTLGSLGLLVPLATRALPLLLLFITFLFINAEVWQVASTMDGGVLWLVVLLFASVAVAFLLSRLPEEVAQVRDSAHGERLVAACAGTPVESVAREVADHAGADALTRLQQANLVLVLLVAQVVQVLLLSLAVFGFFLLFGVLAINDEVVAAWTGSAPRHLPSALGTFLPISYELLQVAIFLAAFSGLYFTVYAVNDATYREQFFASISRELERAVGVRTVYLTLLRRGPTR